MLPIIGRCAPSKQFSTTIKRTVVTSARDTVVNVPHIDGPIDLHSKVAKSNLEGGVKVVSYDLPVPQSTISVFVKAGTRYETPQTLHSNAFLKHLTYRGTHEKSGIRLTRDVEHIGASLFADVARDTLSYHTKGLRIPSDASLDILAETVRFVLNPLLLEHEVEATRKIVLKEAASGQKDYRGRVLDLLHSEAFRESGLANPLVLNATRVEEVTPLEIHSHVKNYFYPGDRITVVGTGIEHQFLLDKVGPLFSNPQLKGHYRELTGLTLAPEVPTTQDSTFIGGGVVRLVEPSDTHFGLALPGVSFTSGDRLAFQVLANALRNSGNGLHSALSKYSWVKSLEVSSLNYEDTGLIVVYVNAEAGHGRELSDVVQDVVKKFPSNLNANEIENAKKRVKLDILKDAVTCRFNTVRQLANSGTAPEIGSVDVADVHKAVNAVNNVTPIIAALGDIRGVKPKRV